MSAIICWFVWFIVNGLVLRIMDLIFVVNSLTFMMIILCVALYIYINKILFNFYYNDVIF